MASTSQPPNPPRFEQLIDAREAARILGVSRDQVLRLAREDPDGYGRIKHGPRSVRFRPSAIYRMARLRDGRDGLLASGDVARILGISRQSLMRLVDAGDVRGVKAGSFWRFDAEEIDRYLEAHRG